MWMSIPLVVQNTMALPSAATTAERGTVSPVGTSGATVIPALHGQIGRVNDG